MQHASIYRLAIGFSLAFTLLIGIGVLGYQQNAALVRDANAVSRTHQVIARLAGLAGAVDTANSSVRLAALNHAPDTIITARSAIDRTNPILAELRTLMTDNPNQQQRLDQLEPLLRAHVADLEAVLNGSDPATIKQPVETEIDRLIRTMEQEERQLLNTRTAQSILSVQRTQQIIIGGSVLGLLIGLGTAAIAILALRARNRALSGLALLNAQLDARVQQQTAALSAANEQLAALSRQLLTTQESERRAVAVALHEAIGQEIAAVQLNLQILDDTSRDPTVHAQLNESMAAIDQVLDHIRSLSLDLRPAALDDFGLLEAIRGSVAQLIAQTGLDVTIDATPFSERPPANVETACFRIVQEVMAVMGRAPGARSLHIRLAEQTGAIELTICSAVGDPIGPAPHATGTPLDLVEIRERAAAARGTITIDSTTECGLSIVAHFPLAATVAE